MPSTKKPESLVDRFNILIERSQPVAHISEKNWFIIVAASVVIVLLITVWCLSNGITTIFMHIYYIPIILLAYHYRRTGFVLAVLLSLAYLILSALFEAGQQDLIEGSLLRCIVFIGIAALVSWLSEGLFRSRDELHKVADLLQSSMMNAQVWLTVLDNKGTILIWNYAAERISGYFSAEVVGSDAIWKHLYPDPDYRKQITGTITRIISENNFLENMETTIRCKSGEIRIISWNTRMLPAEHRKPTFIAIGVDITDQKKAEEKISEAVLQISRNVEEMAILNDSIRNPLAIIVGLADLEGGTTKLQIMKAAGEINSIITRLDRGWIESEKVRRFLRVHHQLYEENKEK
jgi:PAS domain S-box-containing protein